MNAFSDAKRALSTTSVGTANGRAMFGETFTPVALIEEMLDSLPAHLFSNPNLRWLDPCAGVANFPIVLGERLMAGLQAAIPDPQQRRHHILSKMIVMVEIQPESAQAIRDALGPHINLHQGDALDAAFLKAYPEKFDVVLGNPPYERIVNGKRSAKNDSLWTKFIDFAYERLVDGGHLLYITPPAWMSPSSKQLKNVILPSTLLHLNVQECARHFKVGSKFAYFALAKTPPQPEHQTTFVAVFPSSSTMHGHTGRGTFVLPKGATFVPQMIDPRVFSILEKTLFAQRPKIAVTYDSDLHRFTKKALLSDVRDQRHPFKVLHTPSQTVWSQRPHKTQGIPKLLIPLTTYFERMMVEDAGVTQGFGYVLCTSHDQAERLRQTLLTAPYRFVANITRWSNFNVPDVMRALPDLGDLETIDDATVGAALGLTAEDMQFIHQHVKPLR